MTKEISKIKHVSPKQKTEPNFRLAQLDTESFDSLL